MKAVETVIQPICDWIFHGAEWLVMPKTMLVVICWCLFVAALFIVPTYVWDRWRDRCDRRMERRNRWAAYTHWNGHRESIGKWEG